LDQQEIKQKLAGLGDMIARALNPDHGEAAFTLKTIKTSDRSTSAKVMLGDRAGFLKLFGDGDAAASAFARERKALELLHEEHVPKLLFVAEKERAILTRFINGTPLLEKLSPETLNQTAEHLGQWFGRLANRAPVQEMDTNWGDYLAKYPAGFAVEILEHQHPILSQSKISRASLSHNDNALGNFILGADRRLYAVDFEDSQMKPEGWDLVTSARALFGQMPDQLPVIAGSLLRGYQLTAKECGLPDNFDQVISAITVASALETAERSP
jgi:tRNA A-37 threonylcarbamoyl transferase component Bud32